MEIAPDAQPKDGGDQWAILAGLRFVLAFVVLMGHMSMYYVGPHDWSYGGLWLNQLGAVLGFFLISGYSIASSIERDQKQFLERRINRIWPLYLATIVIGLGVMILVGGSFATPFNGQRYGNFPLTAVIGTLFMAQTILTAPLGFIGTTWSLSLEWWYYCTAPLLRRLPSWALIAIVAVCAIRYIFNDSAGLDAEPIFGYAWFWIAGFVYYRYRNSPMGALILIVPALAVLCCGRNIRLPCAATICVLIACRSIPVNSEVVRKLLIWLGDLSYPLYLIQFPVLILMTHAGVSNSIVLASAVVMTSAALLHGIDYPYRRWAKMRSRSRATAFHEARHLGRSRP